MERTCYRLVAADLDGTLLEADGKISPQTCALVPELRAAGVVLALATSRRFIGAEPVAQALRVIDPLILYDGAQTRAYPSGEILDERPLDAATAQTAAQILANHGLRPIAQYGNAGGEYLRVGPPEPRNPHVAGYLARFSHQVSIHALDELCAVEAPPLRVAAFGPWRRLRGAAAALTPLPCGVQLLRRGGYGTAEVTVFSPLASKGHALLALAASLGINAHETFAIGDGANDISMLRAAGMSVAMAHADRTTRAAARLVAAAGESAAAATTRMVLAGQVEMRRDTV